MANDTEEKQPPVPAAAEKPAAQKPSEPAEPEFSPDLDWNLRAHPVVPRKPAPARPAAPPKREAPAETPAAAAVAAPPKPAAPQPAAAAPAEDQPAAPAAPPK